MTLSIDIGNTFTKIALMQEGQIGEEWKVLGTALEEKLLEIKESYGSRLKVIGWINVNKELSMEDLLRDWDIESWQIDNQTDFPIVNAYQSPQSLGTDRIVAVIGARQLTEGAVLVIDAGTAITYDYADEEGRYHGGGIAPGMAMRFRALHEFTARLPLVKKVNEPPLIGRNTTESIQSGVINGMLAEVDGMILRYKNSQKSQLSVILTGGDASLFEKRLKNINFASSNLIHLGIYHILTHLRNT